MTENSDSLSVFVLGSNSQVGVALCEYLNARKIPHLSLTLEDMVSTETLTERMAAVGCGYVVNAAFEEPADESQGDWGHWLSLAQVIAKNCNDNNKVLLHMSSAKVFSGQAHRAYVETDEPDANNSLGRTYLQVENAIQSLCPSSVIVRTSWLFSEQVDNFLTRLVGAAIRQESLKISGKLRGCPTDANSVAKVVVGIFEQIDCGVPEPLLWGVYHYVDSDACTMHTFAKTVITVVKSMSEVRVESIEEGETPDMVDGIAQHENFELGCKKILSTFGIKQRTWRRGVHDVLKVKFSTQGS